MSTKERSCRRRGTDTNEKDEDCSKWADDENELANELSGNEDSSISEAEDAADDSVDVLKEAVEPWKASECNLPDTEQQENGSDDEKRKSADSAGVRQDAGWAWLCMLGCFVMHFFVGGFDRTFGVIYAELIDDLKVSATSTAGVAGVMTSLRLGCGPLASALSNRFGTRKVAMVGGLLYATGVTLSAFTPHIVYIYFTLGILTGFGGSLLFTPAFICVNYHFTKWRAVAIGVATAGTGVGTFFLPLFTRWLILEYGYRQMMIVVGGIAFNLIVCGAVFRPVNLLFVKHLHRSPKPKRSRPVLSVGQTACDADLLESKRLEAGTEVELVCVDQKDLEAAGTAAAVSVAVALPEEEKKRRCDFLVRRLRSLLRVFDVHLLRDVNFLMFCLTCAMTNMAYQSVPVLLVHYASERGYSKDIGADLIAIGGVADTVSRAATGFVFAAPFVRRVRKYVWIADVFIIGVDICLYAFAQSVWYFRVCAAVYGLTTGVYASQLTVIAADLVTDKSRVPSAIGLTVFFRGVGVVLGPFAAGFCKDMTGEYSASFIFCGCVAMVGAVATTTLGRLIKYWRATARRQRLNHAAISIHVSSPNQNGAAVANK